MVIDEAAAIPLPLVRSILGPYLVFMASTINGYMVYILYQELRYRIKQDVLILYRHD